MNLYTRFSARPLTLAIAGVMACAIPASMALPVTGAAAQTNQQNQLEQAIRAVRSITTLTADIRQSARNGQVVEGKLTLKQPGKIRFDFLDADNTLTVANGSALTWIDYDVQQVERWPIGDSPLGALLDPDRDLRRYGKLVPTNNSNVVSIAVSDPAKPEYGTLTLIFQRKASAPGGLELVSWVALDSQNTRTTVRLANHRYGISISDSVFRYRDPRRTTRRPG